MRLRSIISLDVECQYITLRSMTLAEQNRYLDHLVEQLHLLANMSQYPSIREAAISLPVYMPHRG